VNPSASSLSALIPYRPISSSGIRLYIADIEFKALFRIARSRHQPPAE
jgi:hypothetical protein